MNWHTKHPTRNHAFLSRLHDGDLSPAERAHFEAHRAHCAECRSTADEFEHALSLFRSARSAPPPADMAGRVLRKLRSAGHSRRTPFGDLFAVDLRWAGGFAVALLVVILAAPFALRQSKTPAGESTITVALQQRDAALTPIPPAAPSEEARGVAPALPQREAARRRAAAVPPASYAAQPPAGARPSSSMAQERENEDAAAPEPKVQAPAPPQPAAASAAAAGRVQARGSQSNKTLQQPGASLERQGGEGARDQNNPAVMDGVAADRPARIVVSPLDGQGAAPGLAAGPDASELSRLRGRSFLVVVNGQGRVIELREMAEKKAPAETGKRGDGALFKEKDKGKTEADPIKGLRFAAGEKARRLLVRVE